MAGAYIGMEPVSTWSMGVVLITRDFNINLKAGL